MCFITFTTSHSINLSTFANHCDHNKNHCLTSYEITKENYVCDIQTRANVLWRPCCRSIASCKLWKCHALEGTSGLQECCLAKLSDDLLPFSFLFCCCASPLIRPIVLLTNWKWTELTGVLEAGVPSLHPTPPPHPSMLLLPPSPFNTYYEYSAPLLLQVYSWWLGPPLIRRFRSTPVTKHNDTCSRRVAINRSYWNINKVAFYLI